MNAWIAWYVSYCRKGAPGEHFITRLSQPESRIPRQVISLFLGLTENELQVFSSHRIERN